jgi:basic amino acid/polyamine antiporter, APA family
MDTPSDSLMRTKPLPRAGVHSTLDRSIGTFQLTMFGVGATVGTGIFFVLPEAVPAAGPAVVLAFLIAGLAAGLSALCYAEMASAIPVSGSTFSYTYHAIGQAPAVGIAACVLLEYVIATAAVAVGWSGYFNELTDKIFGARLPDALSYGPFAASEGDPTGILNLPAVILIILCAMLLIRGASESATVNTIMVLIKLGVLLLFVVVAATAWETDRFNNFFEKGPSGVEAAAAVIFFSFIGLDAIATAGEEVKDPQSAMPKAILGALAIVVTIYLAVAATGVASQDAERFEDPDQQSAGLSVILENITGSAIPGTILAAGAVISVFSVTLVSLYGSTRLVFAMSRDGLFPKKFSDVSPRTLTPIYNTIAVAIVVAFVGGLMPSGWLWNVVSIGTLFAFSVVAIGVMVLRRIAPDLHRPYRVPGYPVTPVLTVIACLYVMQGLGWLAWTLFGLTLLALYTLYFAWARRRMNAILDETDTANGVNA